MLKLGAVPTVFDSFPDRLKPTSTKRKAPPLRSQFPPKQPDRGSVSEDEEDACHSKAFAAATDANESSAYTSEPSDLRDNVLQHVHCECVDSLQRKVESLQHDIACLQSESSAVKQAKLADEGKVKHDFCLGIGLSVMTRR